MMVRGLYHSLRVEVREISLVRYSEIRIEARS